MAGSWNGASLSDWNGAALSEWNGSTGITAGGSNALLNNIIFNFSLNEASGTRSGAIGAFSKTAAEEGGTVGNTTGEVSNAAQVSGSNSLVITSDADIALGADTDFTIAGVFRTTSLAGYVPIILKVDGTNEDWGLFVDPNGAVNLIFGINDATTLTGPAMTENTTYFFVAWHDAAANTINVQVNNGSVASVAHAGGTQNTSSEIRIARFGSGNRAPANMWFDEITYWKAKFDATQRTKMYTNVITNGVAIYTA